MRRKSAPSGPQLAQDATGAETEGVVDLEGRSASVAAQRASAGPPRPSLAREEGVRVTTTPDFGSALLLACPRHVGRLSLSQLEALAVEMEQGAARVEKAGVVVVQRRASENQDPPRLFVMTETAWRRLIGGAAIDETETEETSQRLVGGPYLGREPVPRPAPEVVREVARTLRGERLLRPSLVQALRDQTGCSRAGAYRAIEDALVARRIR